MNDKDLNLAQERIVQTASQLPQEVMPERDLWAAIEEGIDAPEPSLLPWKRYLAQAAAVVFLVGASSGLTYLAVGGNPGNVSPVANTSPMPLQVTPASFGSQFTLGAEFDTARRDLEDRLAFELDRLSPTARADVETNIQTIRTAIGEINAELANAPDNPLLQELLLSTYQEELALMRKVNGISSNVMLREDI